MKKILITGAAGFIGFHLTRKLTSKYQIVGLDNINNYYDINLKYGRLNELGIETERIKYNNFVKSEKYDNLNFIKLNLEDKENINKLFQKEKFVYVLNIAAQPGVRYSITHPESYINSNCLGFFNILEACRIYKIKHLVYASSSSVYGLNNKMPLSTSDNVAHPISLYAATKRSNELFAHTYSYLYQLPTTGLRFFTVYGPWGRPDMALFKFVKLILLNKPIEVYNYGNMMRDFTYIDDIVNGINMIINKIPLENQDWEEHTDPSSSVAPFRIYNIGKGKPVKLLDMITILEEIIGKKANKKFKPLQPGDMVNTHSDVQFLTKEFNYKPATSLRKGVEKFVEWFQQYYEDKIFTKNV